MLRVKGKGRSMILRTQTGTKSTAMRLPGIKWVAEQEGWGRGGTGRLFRKSRIWAEGKGIISLFWGSGFFFHDVMIFDFKFGSNRTAGSEDAIIFVAAHGPHRTIPILVVSDFCVSYVSVKDFISCQRGHTLQPRTTVRKTSSSDEDYACHKGKA